MNQASPEDFPWEIKFLLVFVETVCISVVRLHRLPPKKTKQNKKTGGNCVASNQKMYLKQLSQIIQTFMILLPWNKKWRGTKGTSKTTEMRAH